MKRIVSLMLMIAILLSCCAYAETGEFDLDVFTNQKKTANDSENQYIVTLDDMEAQGFIKLNRRISPQDADYRCDENGLADGFLYLPEPDIYLAMYGTAQFMPVPRIWFRYYGDYTYLYNTVIFKIGDTTYTFNDCGLTSSIQPSTWSKTTNWESDTVCLCYSNYIPFMDAWIENGTNPIKVRLKDDYSGRDAFDFIFPQAPQADILLMFQNFKDAGGYNLLPTLE